MFVGPRWESSVCFRLRVVLFCGTFYVLCNIFSPHNVKKYASSRLHFSSMRSSYSDLACFLSLCVYALLFFCFWFTYIFSVLDFTQPFPSLTQCYKNNQRACCVSAHDSYIAGKYGEILSPTCLREYQYLENYFCLGCYPEQVSLSNSICDVDHDSISSFMHKEIVYEVLLNDWWEQTHFMSRYREIISCRTTQVIQQRTRHICLTRMETGFLPWGSVKLLRKSASK